MNNVVVGIQARTNSSRLPGKVLLPIGGLPIAVLAAKRAANNGSFNVTVLTSEEDTDSQLCHILQEHNINFYRGSLNNVLKRFVDAFSDYDDNTIVIRLTADNVVPDAPFLQEMVDEFLAGKYNYLDVNEMDSGLPYGFSAEVTYLSRLREASLLASTEFELEHVTPYIRNKYGARYFKKYNSLKLGYLRCTVDSLDDYLKTSALFNSVEDPVNFSSWNIIDSLKMKYNNYGKDVSKLVLGCVQLGLDYGIINKHGKPKRKNAFDMLSYAVSAGVEYLDTANAYGDSESVIGSWLAEGWQGRTKIITKLDPAPLEAISKDSSKLLIDASVKHAFLESCKNLGCKVIDVYMLHLASQITSHNGYIYDSLLALKSQGKIVELGVSVQTPEELLFVLSLPDISYIQLPFNLFDRRWESVISSILMTKSKRNLSIHVRSVFLQGLLLTSDVELWSKALDVSPKPILSWLTEMSEKLECSSIYEFAIRYVKSQVWIDHLVLGSESLQQVKSNLAVMKLADFSEQEIELINNSQPDIISDKMLNPSKWS